MQVLPGSDEADDSLLDLFVRQAERAASVVHRCEGEAEILTLVQKLAVDGRVSISETLAARHPRIVSQLERAYELIRPADPAEAAAAAVGVSLGEALVIETGSVLVSEPSLADRLVSMLSPILVQVVPADSILPSLEDVGALLAERHDGGVGGYHALVTGPSRSADIERSLTIGVQGPSEVHVAILLDAGQGELR